MTATALDVIPARRGKAIGVREGQRLKVVNTHGSQVLDTWAFREGDMAEYLSMEHTRSVNSRWLVTVGTRLVSTRRRTLLEVIADTSPGRHDALLPACSAEIYRELGCTEAHRSCEDNLHDALAAIGLSAPCVPAPLNLFMNVPIHPDGRLDREPPASRPGDAITFRAALDVVVVFSACPQDITPINGLQRTPTDAHFAVLD
jgi:uncharacterized protein YcgI (DUF1989 family)